MAKIIGKGERKIMYGFAIIVDIIQLILDIFVVTEIINHVIDIIVGIIIAIYGSIRGIFNGKKILVLIAYFIAEQIPFVNALPFWTLDIKNLYSGIPSSKEELESQNAPDTGTTPPRLQRKPVNAQEGVRPPNNI